MIASDSIVERGINLLNYSRMSCRELRDKLIRKGESEEDAEYCVERLTELGLLNDRQYALDIASHYSRKGYGRGRIAAELFRRGVPKEFHDEALCSVPEVNGKLQEFIAKKLSDPNDKAQINKICASLSRRGFSMGEIKTAMSDYLQCIEVSDE